MYDNTEKIELIRSKRRSISVEIKSDGRIVCRAPLHMSMKDIRRFIDDKSEWIEKHLCEVRQRQNEKKEAYTDEEIALLYEKANCDIPERAERISAEMGVTYGRISIKKQKTRWGSCSSKGNLNFNCLLMLCPEEVRDYVIVHELAHRKELNHSARFWALVANYMPDYKERRKWLKDNGGALIDRI